MPGKNQLKAPLPDGTSNSDVYTEGNIEYDPFHDSLSQNPPG